MLLSAVFRQGLLVGASIFASVAFAQAADGCADGTYSKTVSPDGNATSFLFDDLSASAGGGVGTARSRTSCNLKVDVAQPSGHSVYALDYRGFATTSDGQAAAMTASADGRIILRHQITGPLDEDLLFSERVGVSGNDTLNTAVALEARGTLDDDFDVYIGLDTLDIARIGFTTTQSVQASADHIARQRQTLAFVLSESAESMLGLGERFDRGNYIALFTSSQASAGFNGRFEAGDGWTVLGGAAAVNPNRTGASVDTLALLSAGVRYTTPEAPWRTFAEAGAWGSPNVSASYSRSYLDGTDTVFTGGTQNGAIISGYARAGVILAPGDGNEFALSARYTQSLERMSGYSETASDDNLFAATGRGGSTSFGTLAAEVGWSHQTDGPLDMTLTGTVGRTFANKDAAPLRVDWVGNVSGRTEDIDFATLAGRVGWQINTQWKVNTTLAARFREDEDTRLDIGASLQSRF